MKLSISQEKAEKGRVATNGIEPGAFAVRGDESESNPGGGSSEITGSEGVEDRAYRRARKPGSSDTKQTKDVPLVVSSDRAHRKLRKASDAAKQKSQETKESAPKQTKDVPIVESSDRAYRKLRKAGEEPKRKSQETEKPEAAVENQRQQDTAKPTQDITESIVVEGRVNPNDRAYRKIRRADEEQKRKSQETEKPEATVENRRQQDTARPTQDITESVVVVNPNDSATSQSPTTIEPERPAQDAEEIENTVVETAVLEAVLVNDDDDANRHLQESEREEIIAKTRELVELETREKILSNAVQAEKVDDAEKSNRGRKVLVLLLLVIIVVAIVVGITVGGDKGGSDAQSPAPTFAPTALTPSDILRQAAIAISGEDVISNELSAQHQALNWLLNNDTIALNIDFNTTSEDVYIERYILALVYFNNGGSTWPDSGHNFLNSSTSVCQWNDGVRRGAFCDDGPNVLRLFLDVNIDAVEPNTTLIGTIPSELSELKFLRYLYFDGSLLGSIPSSIAALADLEYLGFSGSTTNEHPEAKLTGTLPAALGGLRKLTTMNIVDQQLYGSIPASLTQMDSLLHLILFGNRLTGTISPFGTRVSLRILWLVSNDLTGTIPESIRLLGGLEDVRLDSNRLSGTLPDKLGSLTALTELTLRTNHVTGRIPTVLPPNLQVFIIQENSFSGTIPSELGSLDRLQRLSVASNNLSGSLPAELGSLRSLRAFSAADNLLSGDIPVEMGNLDLDILYLSDNDFTGSFDPALCLADREFRYQIQADCRGPAPEVECSCCTSCCSDGDANVSSTCETEWLEYCEIEAWNSFLQDDVLSGGSCGTECDCVIPTDENVTDSVILTCRDTKETCSLDGSVCFVASEFGWIFGISTEMFFESQYVVGRTETFLWKFDGTTEWGSFFFNGQQCRSFLLAFCKDSTYAANVDCSNIEDGGFFLGCEAYGGGPFDLFNFENLQSWQGCGRFPLSILLPLL